MLAPDTGDIRVSRGTRLTSNERTTLKKPITILWNSYRELKQCMRYEGNGLSKSKFVYRCMCMAAAAPGFRNVKSPTGIGPCSSPVRGNCLSG